MIFRCFLMFSTDSEVAIWLRRSFSTKWANYHQKILKLTYFLMTLCAGGDIVSPSRHCLTQQTASLPGQTLSHPAHSLSAWSDIVWPDRQPLWLGRQCLAGQTMSHLAHSLSGRSDTRPAVCLTWHTTSLVPQCWLIGIITLDIKSDLANRCARSRSVGSCWEIFQNLKNN